MSPEEIKQFDDPLMGRMNRRKETQAVEAAPSKGGGKLPLILAALGLVAVLGTVVYFLYQAQQRIDALNTDLAASRQNIDTVSQSLRQSQAHIGNLEQTLDQSQAKLSEQGQRLNRYQSLYSNLKTQQGEQSKELETISIRKADRAEVDQVKTETAAVREQVGEIDSRMIQVNSNISDLREQTTRNRGDLEGHTQSIERLRQTAAANADEISGIKKSLDREYYNFELQKKGAVMKVFEVALSLKGTDFKKQRYTLEILADGQRIQKKNQYINEPIYFYVKDSKKPFEILVNRVDKSFVVGYLSVPKG